MVDDMIDTAGTVAKGAQALAGAGRRARSTWAPRTAIFSGKARQSLEEAPIEQVVVTNTVPIPEERQFDKLQVLSIAPLIAMRAARGVRRLRASARSSAATTRSSDHGAEHAEGRSAGQPVR